MITGVSAVIILSVLLVIYIVHNINVRKHEISKFYCLQSSFHVGVKFGDTVHMSEPVPVSEEEVDEQRYRNDLGQTLFIDSYVYMPIYADVQGKPKVKYSKKSQ